MYKHLLVATDGSKLSAKAVTHAIGLAQVLGAKLTAFYASPEYPIPIAIEGVSYNPMTPKEYTALCKKEADKILRADLDQGAGGRSRVQFRARDCRGAVGGDPRGG